MCAAYVPVRRGYKPILIPPERWGTGRGGQMGSFSHFLFRITGSVLILKPGRNGGDKCGNLFCTDGHGRVLFLHRDMRGQFARRLLGICGAAAATGSWEFQIPTRQAGGPPTLEGLGTAGRRGFRRVTGLRGSLMAEPQSGCCPTGLNPGKQESRLRLI